MFIDYVFINKRQIKAIQKYLKSIFLLYASFFKVYIFSSKIHLSLFANREIIFEIVEKKNVKNIK